MINLITNPFEYIMSGIYQYIIPNNAVIGFILLMFALLVALSNGVDFNTSLMLISPLLIGTIASGFIPHLLWIIIMLFSTILWVAVAMKLINLTKGD